MRPSAPRLDPAAPAGALEKRHVLLLNPFYPKDPHASFGKHVLTPSLALTSLAGATPESWRVEMWDENLLNGSPPLDPLPAVVGITVHLTFAERAYALARHYRARGSKVVLGGLHAQSNADELAHHADAVVIGEGTAVWPKVLADIEANRLAPVYRGSYREPYDQVPPPRREVLDRRAYLSACSLIATRGCANRCDFCYLATDELFMPSQQRNPREVAREIAAEAAPYAVFLDNNLGANPRYLLALCHELEPLEIIWSAAVTLDVTDAPGLVRAMAQAGCTGVFIGFESLTDANLTDARKRTPLAEDYARRIRILHDVGIQVNGSFVFGFDHDRPDVFAATADWVEEQRLECATFHILTPYPGTPLFLRMQAEGRILHEDWSRYDTAHAVFRPKHMSPAELEAGYAATYERLFTWRSIWRRRPTDVRAVPAYLAMSQLYKRSNFLWQFLIEHNLTAAAWRPLVELTRRRHLAFRRRLARSSSPLLAPGLLGGLGLAQADLVVAKQELALVHDGTAEGIDRRGRPHVTR
jgi:radical SAM superfamily enzyme YgiQ (UPF0313 family)